MKFLTIKRRTLCIILISIVLICAIFGIFYAVQTTSSPKPEYSIVIDAGHGGVDGGCVGKNTGITESELNLIYAKKLQELCSQAGLRVVMTRADMNGLYSLFATNKKKSEMKKREQIINESDADLLISIHMNSLPIKSVKGAQVFFRGDNLAGKEFADSITNSLKNNLEYIRGDSKIGDYYILNCNDKAGILIECGFLSSPEEEILLSQSDYIQKFCNAVMVGIFNFLDM